MRRIFELAVNRLFRSRWGVALLIGALVLGVVGVGRIFTSGEDRSPALNAPPPGPTISIDPKNDDSIIISEPPTPPSLKPGTAEPETVAYAFASAWVDHETTAKKWLDGLLPHATADLADKLSGVDPEGVPADRIVGRPELVPVSDGLMEAVVAVNSGQVRLRLIATEGKWLVDGVDWEQA
jgi:hypothetical protein